ncbi:hypothetical protein AB0M39_35220 [Streptomyces sp. NPDC051907]|uniref:hypothetical protein n=1 Tax=Streptomyces sp. NPDC051907 TaxID=3155284 RepID=UPI0034136EA6
MSVSTQLKQTARDLISDQDFDLVTKVVLRANRESGMERELAESIVDEALKFEAACAANTGEKSLSPSRLVDEGWHAIILATRVKQRLAAKIGKFNHHVPEFPSADGGTLERRDDAAVRSMEAIRAAGYQPNELLWTRVMDENAAVTADCMHTECHDGGSACSAPPSVTG